MKTKYTYKNPATAGNTAWRTGQISGVTVNGSSTVTYTYDTLGRTVKTSLYTGANNRYETEYGYLAGAGQFDTTTLVNRVKQGGVTFDYTYDALGNILTVKENGELKISYAYDVLNQLVREDNSYLGRTVTYAYDLAGNILEKKEYAGAQHGEETLGEPTSTITYSYPATGWKDRPERMRFPEFLSWQRFRALCCVFAGMLAKGSCYNTVPPYSI